MASARPPMANKRTWLTAVGLTLLWWIGCALRYWVASARADECYTVLGTGNQADLCIRNAIEARDAVISWAILVPLCLLMAAAFAYEVTKRR
jgi:hypothetical protein